jgi:hypothetical protein
MKRECGTTACLPPTLAVLALYHVKEAVVENELQCFLEAHSDGDHYGLVADTARDAPDLWATWSGANPPAVLTRLTACARDNGKEGGRQDACSLFTRHPGRCTFDLVGQEAEIVRSCLEHAPREVEADNRRAGPDRPACSGNPQPLPGTSG